MITYLIPRLLLVKVPMTERPYSEYAERNGVPILDVLQNEFRDCTKVLEIGSGTGQHAVRFAKALPFLQWQSSDLDENHAGISAWIDAAGLTNLLSPVSLDVLTDDVAADACDAVYSANTSHIMSVDAVVRMFRLVGKTLTGGGIFCLYGPFRLDGVFNSPSNEEFHAMLRSRDPLMGIRHLETLDGYGREHGLTRVRLYTMPANNYVAVWRKDDG